VNPWIIIFIYLSGSKESKLEAEIGLAWVGLSLYEYIKISSFFNVLITYLV
jgi:hypothetical protein